MANDTQKKSTNKAASTKQGAAKPKTAVKSAKSAKVEPAPVEVKPTQQHEYVEMQPVKPRTYLPEGHFSNTAACIYFALAVLGGIATLVLGLTTGLTWYLIAPVVVLVAALLLFFAELKKMPVTQADIDKWCDDILAKHPTYDRLNLVTLEDVQHSALTRFSYWARTFKVSFAKVLVYILLPMAAMCACVGVIVPLATGNIGTKVDIVGIYVAQDTSNSVVTAYEFKTNNILKVGTYNKDTHEYTWEPETFGYKIGKNVVEIGAGTLTIVDGGKQLVDKHDIHYMKM